MQDDAEHRGQTTAAVEPNEDSALLRCYIETCSEAAFASLVERQLPLVYATALRLVGGDTHLAQDVAQSVFTDLARKATALSRRPVLAGWLYTSARFAAAKAVRTARRRQVREQEAHLMQTLMTETGADADWARLRPVIDDALQTLSESDREAVLLRFFEGRPFPEVGVKLALSADAARLRVERALEKMRRVLARHGVSSTTAALAVALASQPAIAVPAGLVASVTGAALAGAAVSGGAGALLAFLTMSKIKVGVVSALIFAGLTTVVVEVCANRQLRAEIGDLQSTVQTGAQLQQETRRLAAALQTSAAQNPETAELVRLRARAAILKARPEGVTDERMKPMAACQNVGRATPAASLETGLWAAQSGDLEELMRGYYFPEDARAQLAAFFARQSDVVRTRYGTPERLLGALWRTQNDELPTAFQITDEKRSLKTEEDAAQLQVWYRRPSGDEKATRMFFQRGPDGWGLVKGLYRDDTMAKLASRIDQATGELHPTPR